MKRIALLALLLAAPAYAAVEVPYTEWTVYAETQLNSDDNLEARVGATVDNWWIDLAARDADYATATGLTCRSSFVCKIGTAEELEYEARAGLRFFASDRITHGPVVSYTKRAGGFDTWAAGWRVEIAGGGGR